MAETARALEAFLARHGDCALVEVAEAKGSTPREAGAWMLVAADASFGTIGGGQLEWMAIDEARRVLVPKALRRPSPACRHPSALHPATGWAIRPLAGPGLDPVDGEEGALTSGLLSLPPFARRDARQGFNELHTILDIPLGPEIGQCCGGRVRLAVRRVEAALRSALVDELRAAEAARPEVLLFGGGHVGHALAAALALLPLKVKVVETRADALEGLPEGVEARLAAVPEDGLRAARAGSVFVILTHDHALDFLLAAEALKRGDAAYVGMIGSKTKRATFRRWFLAEAGGTEEQIAALTCPIGGRAVHDKRPAVIAAMAAAEIVAALSAPAPARRRQAKPA